MRQFGVVGLRQLRELGFVPARVDALISAGRLHRIHPGAYAVGHPAITYEGHLAAALFWAGREAALSHLTAAAWWGLCDAPTGVIHLSCTRRRASRPGIRMHQPRDLQIVRHERLPVTTVPRTLVDVAATVPPLQLRRIVAEADFKRLLSVPAVDLELRRGRRGSAVLRRALEIHRPELAQTLSTLELQFIPLIEDAGLPMPQINARICGHMVDALWRERRLVAELDGGQVHGTVAAVRRDRARDLDLRRAGLTVVRYSYDQVIRHPEAVATDLRRALAMI